MSAFNLNKLRSCGLRYIVADRSDEPGKPGAFRAFERPPIRSKEFEGHWVLCEDHQPPKTLFETDYEKFRSLTEEQREEMYQEYKRRSNKYYAYKDIMNRPLLMYLSECPYPITWDDEPFDLVEQGIVAEKDMKRWGRFPKF